MRAIAPAALALLLSAGGCPSEAILPGGPPTLEFTATQGTAGQYHEQPQVTASGEEGRIVVKALLSTPDPCQELKGTVDGSGDEVTLTVEVRRVGEGCIQVIGSFAYEAAIRNLEPGTYRLRVVHRYPGTGWPGGTVHQETVRVR